MYTYIVLIDGRCEIRDPQDCFFTTVNNSDDADTLVWDLNDLSLITRH